MAFRTHSSGKSRLICSRAAQRGFSLLETIAALAIIALASLALFQSASLWFRLSASAADAADSATSGVIALERFQSLVRGLIYAWPEQADEIFVGGPDGFRGLTRTPLHFADPGPEPVAVRIEPGEEGDALVYRSGLLAWTILDGRQVRSGALGFSYLGADGVWRAAWPPEATPIANPGDDPSLFRTPQLPLAIRLTAQDGTPFAWIADIGGDRSPSPRNQDILDEFDGANP